MQPITDPSKLKAAVTYNAASDHFDDEALSFWNKYGQATIDRLFLQPGMKVLDVACGTGASAFPAAKQVGDTGSVTAVDLAENLLASGRTKAIQLNINNIQFQFGDMTALPYPDESFDAVVCVFGIFFVPDMQALLKELWRMVKPNGKLAVTTWGPDLFAPLYNVWREAVKKERPDLYSAFNPWDKITDTNSVTELFHSAGIMNTEVVAEDGIHNLRSPEDWWTIVLGSGFRWTADQLGTAAAARVRHENLEWIKENNVSTIETNVIYAVAIRS